MVTISLEQSNFAWYTAAMQHRQAGTEPYFFPGGAVGCLLIHGFTSTPYDLRLLGEHLHQQGYTVHGPRLTGHAATIQDINRSTWQQWYYSVLDGYHLLKAQCESVIVIGFSMGGALSIVLAAHEPIAALITLAAPHHLDSPYKPFIPLFSRLLDTFPKGHLPAEGEEDPLQERVKTLQAERGEPQVGIPGFTVWPVKALPHLLMLLKNSRDALPNIIAPALMLHGKQDETVPFSQLGLNYEELGSTDKRIAPFERSGHHLAFDVESEAVFALISNFIRQKVEV